MNLPTKPTIKTEIIPLLIIVLSVALSFYFYAHFPDRVASHWNFEGVVDGYSSKAGNAFGILGVIIGMYLLFLVIPFLDPKKDRYESFANVYHGFKTVMVGFMFMIYLFTGLYNLGYNINIGIVTPVMVGILMIFIGNYLGKIKNNWFMGIRTPWTLSSENVWNKTHRVGGWCFIIFGLLIMTSPFLGKVIGIGAFIIGLLIAVVYPIIYSYLEFRKEKMDKHSIDK